jgi:hypothetical protein
MEGEKPMTTGSWFQKESGEIVWKEGVTEKTPSEMGLVKQAEFDLFFVKEVENPDEWEEKTKTFFIQHVKMKIRQGDNLWLRLGDSRNYFVTDILNGQTIRAPLESDGSLIVEKSKPKKTTLEAVKLAKDDKTKAFYFFGRVEGTSDKLEYGTTVSAY